jgi:(p)ppGpp synthase/HD superfamily hydrolase
MTTPSWSPELYRRALIFAAEAHGAQKVPGSERPYVTHPVEVAAELCAALWLSPVEQPDLAVQCALLHDTVEDTAVRIEEIEARFGGAVARGVAALSKDASLPKEARMVDSLRRIQGEPREVSMVKLADRIVNLAEPPAYWSLEKIEAYRREAIEIAEALGAASAILDARLREKITEYARR